jgi:hypothetical protein
MDVSFSSETSVDFNRNTRRYTQQCGTFRDLGMYLYTSCWLGVILNFTIWYASPTQTDLTTISLQANIEVLFLLFLF